MHKVIVGDILRRILIEVLLLNLIPIFSKYLLNINRDIYNLILDFKLSFHIPANL